MNLKKLMRIKDAKSEAEKQFNILLKKVWRGDYSSAQYIDYPKWKAVGVYFDEVPLGDGRSLWLRIDFEQNDPRRVSVAFEVGTEAARTGWFLDFKKNVVPYKRTGKEKRINSEAFELYKPDFIKYYKNYITQDVIDGMREEFNKKMGNYLDKSQMTSLKSKLKNILYSCGQDASDFDYDVTERDTIRVYGYFKAYGDSYGATCYYRDGVFDGMDNSGSESLGNRVRSIANAIYRETKVPNVVVSISYD